MFHSYKRLSPLPKIAFLFVATQLFSACDLSSFPTGHLEGSLIARNEISKPAGPGQTPFFKMEKKAVGIDIVLEKSKKTFVIEIVEIKDSQKTVLSTFKIYDMKGGQFKLEMPDFPQPFEMKPEGECYTHTADLSVLLCFTPDQLRLEVSKAKDTPNYTLIGNRFNPEEPFVLETPVQMTLTDAVKTALNKNFDSLIEFQHAYQAKHQAHAAWLNLLPRFGFSDLVSILPPSYWTVVGSIGDVAPFLFPSRWFQARQASLRSDAQNVALTIMQVDLATNVEGLSYTLQRDQNIAQVYAYALEAAKKGYAKSLALQQLGKRLIGAPDTLKTVLNGMAYGLASFNRIVLEDRIALAQSLGLNNPEGIKDLIIDSEYSPIENAKPLQFEEILPMVLARSLELRQIDFLSEAAHYSKLETIFNWLDPNGDPNLNLGFAYGENLTVSDSRMNEIKIKREQLQTLISQKVDNSIKSLNFHVANFQLLKESRDLQRSRLERILGQLDTDPNISEMDIQGIFQDYLISEINQQGLLAEYRVVRANLDRLLLLNYYKILQPSETRRIGDPLLN